MRKLLITAIGLILALSLAVSSAASAEEPAPGSEEALPGAPASELTPLSGCPIGIVCVYTGTGFTGAEGRTPCSQTGFHPLAGNKWSGANGCESRAVFLRHGGAYTGVCLPPLTSDGKILFDEFRLGEVGSHC